MTMKATVCEFSDDPAGLERDWRALSAHVRDAGSQLVVLPEMPFYPWIARSREVSQRVWLSAVAAHEAWLARLPELGSAVVVGTRPLATRRHRLNEGFVWTAGDGYRPVHAKVYLPDEPGFWEASWYDRGPRVFEAVEIAGVRVGFLICTELWFNAHARDYAGQGVHVVVCPRATPLSSVDKWIVGGRTAAVVSGAFCLSSNRSGTGRDGLMWGGAGWMVEPAEGRLLGITESARPFLTLDLDLAQAESAKLTYPRYVAD